VRGKVWVHGEGDVVVGDRVVFDAADAPIELHAAAGATIAIGDDCTLAAGTSIDATSSIVIGARCRIGAFCKATDNHFHPRRGDGQVRPAATPVVVEDDVELGPCTILLPGAHVRRGSRIAPRAVIRRRVAITDVPHRAPVAHVDVSVVISVSRRTGQLREAIRSVLSQEHVVVEVILLDDGHDQAARQAVRDVEDDRVVYVPHATPLYGRHVRARGRYVHVRDDDDLVVPGAFVAHVAALDLHPLCAMSMGVVSLSGAEGPCLVRRSALEETGGFDPALDVIDEAELAARGIRERGCVFVDAGTGRASRDIHGLTGYLTRTLLRRGAGVALLRGWREEA
jgi:acetyltransferase-like isoleucine patch superfamily enzyme